MRTSGAAVQCAQPCLQNNAEDTSCGEVLSSLAWRDVRAGEDPLPDCWSEDHRPLLSSEAGRGPRVITQAVTSSPQIFIMKIH